ncbi:plasmid mobilization protein [Aliiroseovarius sp. CAU 1755]
MANSGSETRKRRKTLSARFNDAEAALVKEQACRAGLPVSALIRHAVLNQPPPRKSRTPPLDRKTAAQLLGQIGELATALRDASQVSDGACNAAVIEAAHRDLADMRTALFEALGREP